MAGMRAGGSLSLGHCLGIVMVAVVFGWRGRRLHHRLLHQLSFHDLSCGGVEDLLALWRAGSQPGLQGLPHPAGLQELPPGGGDPCGRWGARAVPGVGQRLLHPGEIQRAPADHGARCAHEPEEVGQQHLPRLPPNPAASREPMPRPRTRRWRPKGATCIDCHQNLVHKEVAETDLNESRKAGKMVLKPEKKSKDEDEDEEE